MLTRRTLLLSSIAGALAACTPVPEVRLGPDGRPLPRVYRLSNARQGPVQIRMVDGVNALRAAAGVPALSLDARLNAAAETHSRDMAAQNRPWHFGSDGSSPIDRVQRVGYAGGLKGELISETFESELETLAAWMEEDVTRDILLDPAARDMGFAFFQEPNGKIWWTLVTGVPQPVTGPDAGF